MDRFRIEKCLGFDTQVLDGESGWLFDDYFLCHFQVGSCINAGTTVWISGLYQKHNAWEEKKLS